MSETVLRFFEVTVHITFKTRCVRMTQMPLLSVTLHVATKMCPKVYVYNVSSPDTSKYQI